MSDQYTNDIGDAARSQINKLETDFICDDRVRALCEPVVVKLKKGDVEVWLRENKNSPVHRVLSQGVRRLTLASIQAWIYRRIVEHGGIARLKCDDDMSKCIYDFIAGMEDNVADVVQSFAAVKCMAQFEAILARHKINTPPYIRNVLLPVLGMNLRGGGAILSECAHKDPMMSKYADATVLARSRTADEPLRYLVREIVYRMACDRCVQDRLNFIDASEKAVEEWNRAHAGTYLRIPSRDYPHANLPVSYVLKPHTSFPRFYEDIAERV